MYTILMNKNKTLTATVKTNLYQKEKLADKIQFLIPLTYGEHDLSEFIVAMEYVNQANIPCTEILVKDDELYKGSHIRCTIDVDTNLTAFAGDIELKLTLNKIDLETKKQYTLHTSPIIITILPQKDYYAFVPDESLEFVDKMIATLEAQREALLASAEQYELTKADNIVLDEESKELYLTANSQPIGNRILLNDLGEAIAENTEDGLIKVVL